MRRRIKHTWKISDIFELSFKYRNWIVVILLTITIILGMIWIVLQNDYATKGVDLFDTLEEEKRLKAEDLHIRELILHYSSLQYTKEEATKMGFVEATDKDYYIIYAN